MTAPQPKRILVWYRAPRGTTTVLSPETWLVHPSTYAELAESQDAYAGPFGPQVVRLSGDASWLEGLDPAAYARLVELYGLVAA